MDINVNGLRINVPATTTNAWNGGLHAYRDASQLVGGTPGYVNSANVTEVITGKTVSWEYAGLDLLTNNADEGENVARYCKAVKKGAGSTWAVCHEVNDPDNHPGSMVAEENDIWCNGPDNGIRVGSDNVVGDARKINGQTGFGVAEGTVGVRSTACAGTPWARWMFAFWGLFYKVCGLRLEAPPEGAIRGIHLIGKHIVGIDVSDSQCQSVIRMRAGQWMTFEATDQVKWGYDDGQGAIVFKMGDNTLAKLSLNGDLNVSGHLFVNGKQIA